MATWADVTAAEVASGLAGAWDIFDDFRKRDEANAGKPFQVEFAEQTPSGATHPTFTEQTAVRKTVRVPEDADELNVTLDGFVASGTGYLKAELVGTSTITGAETPFTDTSYAAQTLTVASISALRGEEVSLRFYYSHSAGSTVTFKSEDRVTAVWSYD